MSRRRSEPRWTERALLDMLRVRYGKDYGNGVRYVCAEHVRSGAGFEATRTADMIVQDLWPSGGFELSGHEVKTSRADWLTELRDPGKAEEFRRYMHRWWLVVPDAAIVHDDLPDGWGLLVVAGSKLRAAVQAPLLDPDPMPRTMQVALTRAVAKTAAAGQPKVHEAQRVVHHHRAELLRLAHDMSEDARFTSGCTWSVRALERVLLALGGELDPVKLGLTPAPQLEPEHEQVGLFDLGGAA